jgi:hypothetical protein
VTYPERCGIAPVSRGEPYSFELQHGQISARIAPGQQGRNRVAIRQFDADLLIAFDCMVGSDYDASAPVNTTRWDTRATMHRNHGPPGLLDRLG